MSIADKLNYLNETKRLLRESIAAAGVSITENTPFRDYVGKINEIADGGGVSPTPTEWVRPVDWLHLPEVSSDEQKVVGLVAVFDHGSNYVRFSADTDVGTYTVDWGDGTVEDITSGDIAVHQYDFSSLPADTLCERGYKQAIITVTATATGGKIHDLNLSHPQSADGSSYLRASLWLDLTISLPHANSLKISSLQILVRHSSLEQCSVLNSGSATDMNGMFRDCYSLQAIPTLDTSNATDMNSIFASCYSLQDIPTLDTSNVTNISNMFNNCSSLQTIPTLDTSNATNMSNMFNSCYSLQDIPTLDTSNVTNMSNMFYNCNSLQTIPTLDTSSVTNMSNMFRGCNSLQAIPTLDTSNVTNMSNMFNSCNSLRTIPTLDTSNVTNMSNMFNSCYSLQAIPTLDTSNVTNMSNMFNNCFTLGRSMVVNVKLTHSYQNCNLSAEALEEVFNNLATVTTSQTITITSNPGAATVDRTIATDKGWTVIG